MSLRYRLFLLVSGLFIAITIGSYFLGNLVVRQGLKKAQEESRAKLLTLSEQRSADWQDYLASILAENEERINAILTNLSSFSPQLRRFAPTLSNIQKGTWDEAVDLMLEYKWINFLQNTIEGQVSSAIIPKQPHLEIVYRTQIDEDLSWIYAKSYPDPFLGICVPYALVAQNPNNSTEVVEVLPGMIPQVSLLFDAKKMALNSSSYIQPVFEHQEESSWPSIPIKWTEEYELKIAPVIQAFQKARRLLLNNSIQPPSLTQAEVFKKMQANSAEARSILSPTPIQSLLSISPTQKIMQERLEDIVLNYTQINMIWGLIAFHESGIFGKNLFAFPAPSGLALFGTRKDMGMGVNTSDVLFSKSVFDDKIYFETNPPKNKDSNLASSIALINVEHTNRLYLGNTAQFSVKTQFKEQLGYLTLGVDIDMLLQKFVFAIHQTAVLVHQGKYIQGYEESGKELDLSQAVQLPISQILKKTSGVISWKNDDYFFTHLHPFPQLDLHFLILNPEKTQFALMRQMHQGAEQIVDSILFDIHMAALIALGIAIVLVHRISKRITGPITQLALATKEVVKGSLNQAQTLLPRLKHKDEISVLCTSFEEMIKGLQEKEKVKGILNKVVSDEIAQEILKGTVHLGGEEKKATVLFADIRDFTKMTQHMAPKQVIDLLNGCMNRVSYVIDKNSGVIDKFIGDAAMALFGTPISCEEAATRALKSAVEIIDALKLWNAQRFAQGLSLVEIGIGIHTGFVLAGNMGAENRLNYTVLGSNVNLASRLCDAAQKMEILVTKETLDEPGVKDKFTYEKLPMMSFRGIDSAVEVFRIQGIKG